MRKLFTDPIIAKCIKPFDGLGLTIGATAKIEPNIGNENEYVINGAAQVSKETVLEFFNINYLFDFGQAIKHMKDGKKVARIGWNGNKKPPLVSKIQIHIPENKIETVGDYTFLRSNKGEVAVIDANMLSLLESQIDLVNSKMIVNKKGYFQLTSILNGEFDGDELHSLLFHKCPPNLLIDHINGDKLDNRSENIRFVTNQQSVVNTSAKSTSKYSKYKGVTFDKSRNKWMTSMELNGKNLFIKRFETELEAAKYYDKKAYEIHGEYARLNFPHENLQPRMFVFLVSGSTFKVNRPPLLGIYEDGTEINYQPHVDMKTADGTIVPWLCSQSDMLAEDWEVVE